MKAKNILEKKMEKHKMPTSYPPRNNHFQQQVNIIADIHFFPINFLFLMVLDS